jgi:hypothetical protein
MEEILEGCLASDVHAAAVFRAPRDVFLEYWILSRAYVNDEHLLVESFTVQPQNHQALDVESRITQLEALLVTLDNAPENEAPSPEESQTEVNKIEQSTDIETDSSTSSLSDQEFSDDSDIDPVDSAAQQTRDRISQRLEQLKTTVILKSQNHAQSSLAIHTLSVPSPKSTSSPKPVSRSVHPFDQRTVFRVRASKEGISFRRRFHPSVAGREENASHLSGQPPDPNHDWSGLADLEVANRAGGDGSW